MGRTGDGRWTSPTSARQRRRGRGLRAVGGVLAALAIVLGVASAAADPLPSWADGAAKQSILAFVDAVTDPASPDFVPRPERIAAFDNDGTLWAEKPIYVQVAFAIDRVKALAPEHPEWQDEQPFKGILAGDLDAALAGGDVGWVRMLMATHAGNTTEAFAETVAAWLATARHPRFHRPYTELVYQPMLELLVFLRASGFKTFIVSGGGADFMRVWTERVYGIPPEQVVGSTVVVSFQMRPQGPVLFRKPEVGLVDDHAGKPAGIHTFIGRRPVLAFGNSDGDLEMLQWTAAGKGRRFMGLVHHTDAVREWAYGPDSRVGRLLVALEAAQKEGWTVVSMKTDWQKVFPFDPPEALP